jgi:ATP-dependent Clp protease ATP-binding subunit ClpA
MRPNRWKEGVEMAGLRVMLDPTRLGREAEKLEENLRKRVVGQADAIRQTVDLYQMYLAGMATNGRPVGNLLFLGPTGTGKTRTVEAVAESLVGDPRAVVKSDCAEFQHSHEIAKLVGSPPGYLGHRETHPLLSQEALNQYHTETVKLSFVLFDEIEKASDALWNLLLGILDKATLTLGDNRRVDFSRAIIFMTSNLGSSEMEAVLQPGMGFQAVSQNAAMLAAASSSVTRKMERAGIESARRRFTPEFMNRIDKVVVFRPLGEGELRDILDLEIDAVRDRLRQATGAGSLALKLSEGARDLLLREGSDPRYGARHLRRAIERMLVHPMSNLIATGQVKGSDQLLVRADADESRLVFLKEFKGVAPQCEDEAGSSAAA